MDTITTIQDLLTFNGSVPSATVKLTESECHLIAAAPDMYEALEGIANGGLIDYEIINKALAKARGES